MELIEELLERCDRTGLNTRCAVGDTAPVVIIEASGL